MAAPQKAADFDAAGAHIQMAKQKKAEFLNSAFCMRKTEIELFFVRVVTLYHFKYAFFVNGQSNHAFVAVAFLGVSSIP